MANEIGNSAVATDQEKMLAAGLIARSNLKLVLGACCDKVPMKEGAGLVANFVRYKRMNVPLTTLNDDGQDPANSTFTIDSVQVTMDEWGDVLTITNVAQLTAKHPVLQEAMNLLADNAARVMDREIGIVLLAGTNVQYGAGTPTSRSGLATTDTMSNTVINRARITLGNQGAPAKGGPPGDAKQVAAQGNLNAGNAYVGVCGLEVMADLMIAGTSLGTWASVAMYTNAKALYTAEQGTWLGVRWVESNFLPRFRLLGNSTAAVTTANAFGTDTPVVTAITTGGALAAGTYFFKVTRKDLTRGYEEDISTEHSMAVAGAGAASYTFNFSSLTAGYVYQLYFGSVTGDANLKLVAANIAVGTTTTVTAVPSSTVTPPPSNKSDGSVITTYPIFIFAEKAVNWVGFYGIRTYLSQDISIPGNVLRRRRSVGYSFFGKAMIRDQTRLLRIELASTYV